MIIDFIIEDLMLNSYLQKNFHTLLKEFATKALLLDVDKPLQKTAEKTLKNVMHHDDYER
jgi:hypothetical protein